MQKLIKGFGLIIFILMFVTLLLGVLANTTNLLQPKNEIQFYVTSFDSNQILNTKKVEDNIVDLAIYREPIININGNYLKENKEYKIEIKSQKEELRSYSVMNMFGSTTGFGENVDLGKDIIIEDYFNFEIVGSSLFITLIQNPINFKSPQFPSNTFSIELVGYDNGFENITINLSNYKVLING